MSRFKVGCLLAPALLIAVAALSFVARAPLPPCPPAGESALGCVADVVHRVEEALGADLEAPTLFGAFLGERYWTHEGATWVQVSGDREGSVRELTIQFAARDPQIPAEAAAVLQIMDELVPSSGVWASSQIRAGKLGPFGDSYGSTQGFGSAEIQVLTTRYGPDLPGLMVTLRDW